MHIATIHNQYDVFYGTGDGNIFTDFPLYTLCHVATQLRDRIVTIYYSNCSDIAALCM